MPFPNKYRLLSILIIFELTTFCLRSLFGQSINNSQDNFIRTGDRIEQSHNFNSYKTARFLPIVALNQFEDWTSPSTHLSIDGIPFEIFPFNMNTLDLLPIDLLQIDSVSNNYYNSFRTSKIFNSNINLNRIKIPNRLQIKFRGFLGSETGDPLVHVFTKQDSSNINKNKIVPSGVLTVSNSSSNLFYRFTLGYFGFYSTGSAFDGVMSKINNHYFNKQNKQVIGSAELDYKLPNKRILSIYASMISYYGWEVTPYLTTYSHIESYLSTIRFSIKNLMPGFNLLVKGDNTIGIIHEGVSTPYTKFSISQYSLIPNWDLNFSNHFRLGFNFILDYYIIKNIYTHTANYNDFFISDQEKLNYIFSVNPLVNISQFFQLDLKLQYEVNYSNQNALSGVIKLKHEYHPNNFLEFNIASTARFANLTENYGIYNGLESYNNVFDLEGSNNSLTNERVQHIDFTINSFHKPIKSEIALSIFYERIENLIYRKKTFYYIHPITKEPITRGHTVNGNLRKLSGFRFVLESNPFQYVKLGAKYKFVNNNDVTYAPKHQAHLTGTIAFKFNGSLRLSWNYRSKTKWEDYESDSVPEYLKGVPESSTINIQFIQSFFNSYFTRRVDMGLSIMNIFDQLSQNLPNGKSLGRTLVFTIGLII